MKFDDMLNDRKPETCSAELARARLIDAVETFENTRGVFFGNADPGIFYDNFYSTVYFLRIDPNIASFFSARGMRIYLTVKVRYGG